MADVELDEKQQEEQKIVTKVQNFIKKKEISKLITFLEDSSQVFEFCSPQLRDAVYEALLEPVTPGYAYAQRTFDLFAGWKELSFLPADIDLKRLRLGAVYKVCSRVVQLKCSFFHLLMCGCCLVHCSDVQENIGAEKTSLLGNTCNLLRHGKNPLAQPRITQLTSLNNQTEFSTHVKDRADV